MNKIKIYDIRNRDYPGGRGTTFRTLQVAECWVCKVKTNHAELNGYPGYGLRFCCPYSGECWHHELEQKVSLARQLHPKSYQVEIDTEIEGLRKKYQSIIKDDIEGEVDFEQIRGMTNVRGRKPNSNSSHFF